MKLSNAVMCIECEEIFAMGPDFCPSCTCTTFIYLSSLIEPLQVRREIDEVRELHRLFNGHGGRTAE
jgi:predicted  nucleic acid-binding Zn-ribbon protein